MLCTKIMLNNVMHQWGPLMTISYVLTISYESFSVGTMSSWRVPLEFTLPSSLVARLWSVFWAPTLTQDFNLAESHPRKGSWGIHLWATRWQRHPFPHGDCWVFGVFYSAIRKRSPIWNELWCLCSRLMPLGIHWGSTSQLGWAGFPCKESMTFWPAFPIHSCPQCLVPLELAKWALLFQPRKGTAAYRQFMELSTSTPSNANDISHLYGAFGTKSFLFFLAVRGILVEMTWKSLA